MKLESIEVEDYNNYSIDLTEKNYKDIKNFVSRLDLTISQFTILESENEILILETAPGLVNNRIQIKNVTKMTTENFKKLFSKSVQ